MATPWSEAQVRELVERLAARLEENSKLNGLIDQLVAKKLQLPGSVIDARERFRRR